MPKNIEYSKNTAQTGRGPSPGMWGNCPWNDIRNNPNLGWTFFDDFLSFDDGNVPAGYIAFTDTGGTFENMETEVGGVLQIATDGDDNDDSILGFGTSLGAAAGGVLGKFPLQTALRGEAALWFEARVRFPSITAVRKVFVGLAEEARAVNNGLFADADNLTVVDAVGFRLLEDDINAMDAVHATASGAEVVVKDVAQLLVADTFYKFGFRLKKNQCQYFVDGLQVGSDVPMNAANFPDGEKLGMYIGTKTAEAAIALLDADWWRFAYQGDGA